MAPLHRRMLTPIGLALAAMTHTSMNAQTTADRKDQVVGHLTRYVVNPATQTNFQGTLSVYVRTALTEEGNLQAEAYYERDDRSVLWLIERWKNRRELERFARSPSARAVEAQQGAALKTKADTYHVTDLEPMTKEQWRRPARVTDDPITIMLFVDAKAGTQDTFKATYHIAMPAFRGEPGVVSYQLSQFESDETKFVTYEKFRSNDAFQFHLNFPPIKPVVDYLQTSIKKPPFQDGLHFLIEFAPLTREQSK